ncbi:DUF6496 domain-containing protein [Sphingomonas sp.]|uniref:DUF6496 domain-containing protein n=1 Tax=Sphingomonas sp. TaxID=28214 RepID=UPI003CC52AAF
MAKTTKGQDATVERVMHEFKDGTLRSGSGDKVTSRGQAIAIALSEAGESNRVSPAENRRRVAHTRRQERGDGPTRAALYGKAKLQQVAGRSKMSKAELARAVK